VLRIQGGGLWGEGGRKEWCPECGDFKKRHNSGRERFNNKSIVHQTTPAGGEAWGAWSTQKTQPLIGVHGTEMDANYTEKKQEKEGKLKNFSGGTSFGGK